MSLPLVIAGAAALVGANGALQRKINNASGLVHDGPARAAMLSIIGNRLTPAGCLVREGRPGRGLVPNRMVNGVRTPHWGKDILARSGTPVYAAKPGLVVGSGPISGYGETIKICHLDEPDRSTLYAHLQDRIGEVGGEFVELQVGDIVVGGAQIGHSGATTYGPGRQAPGWAPGRASGMAPHLHFEVHPRAEPLLGRTSQRLDPDIWLAQEGIETVCELT